jgi:hypothetical protein
LVSFADEWIEPLNCKYKFDDEELRRIYVQWCDECNDLRLNGFSILNEELSDIKEMGILVAVMATHRFIKPINGDPARETSESLELRKDFLKNCELIFAFDLGCNVIDWHEKHNPDISEPSPSALDTSMALRNDIFRTIESHPEDRKTIATTIFQCLYRRH